MLHDAALLARHGITGPPEVFEGKKGFMEAIAGRFDVGWEHEDLERVRRTILKKFNAEIHSQSTIEAVLALRASARFAPHSIETVEIEIFDVAYTIIGGGEEGDKLTVATKEQADHSLPYLIAVALLDGMVMPEQYASDRIGREDVQNLLRKVFVTPNAAYSAQFPSRMHCHIVIAMKDGSKFSHEQDDYPGFLTHPMSWQDCLEKFMTLCAPFAGDELVQAISGHIADCEDRKISDLTGLLSRAQHRTAARGYLATGGEK